MKLLGRVVRGAETAVGAIVIGYVVFELGRSLTSGWCNRR